MTSDKLTSQNQLPSAGHDTQILAEAFCSWPLPSSVCSDPCATISGYPNRSGTNLITVAEAKAMFDHLVERGLLQIVPKTTDGGEDARKALLAMEAGDLVQLDPSRDLNGFEGSILCVTEVRSWGVIGFVQIPKGGQAFFRAAHSTFEQTGGKAPWMPPRSEGATS